MSEEAAYKLKTLRLAVSAMRDAQKLYFKTRNSQALSNSKKLELQVDRMLEEK